MILWSFAQKKLKIHWAHMVMASLARTLKAWLALVLPEGGRWQRKHAAEKQSVLRMKKFKKFLNLLVRVPCQIVRTRRRRTDDPIRRARAMGWKESRP